jgi:hypothetical protein
VSRFVSRDTVTFSHWLIIVSERLYRLSNAVRRDESSILSFRSFRVSADRISEYLCAPSLKQYVTRVAVSVEKCRWPPSEHARFGFWTFLVFGVVKPTCHDGCRLRNYSSSSLDPVVPWPALILHRLVVLVCLKVKPDFCPVLPPLFLLSDPEWLGRVGGRYFKYSYCRSIGDRCNTTQFCAFLIELRLLRLLLLGSLSPPGRLGESLVTGSGGS